MNETTQQLEDFEDTDYPVMRCPDCDGYGFDDALESFRGECRTCGGSGEVDW